MRVAFLVSGVSILFSVQNQLKLHRKINYRLQNRIKTGSQLEQRSVYRDTNIPIGWLITMISCQRSSRLMMPSTLLTSLTKRRKNTVNKYYQQHDAWNHEADNLTYRPGTPWSIAHAKGQNTLLSDDDILKYHALEQL